MPKVKIDYSNTIFYKIFCKDLSVKELYIGHTTNFVQRKHSHKQGCINPKSANYKCKLYKVIRDNMGWDNWTMEIIAFHNCEDLYSAKKQEQHYFEEYKATLNSIEPLPPRKPKKEVVIKPPKEVLYCDSCRVYFNTRKLQEEHNKRPRHLKFSILPMNTLHNTQVTTVLNKPTKKFHCAKCNYICGKKSDFDKHLKSNKHNSTECYLNATHKSLLCNCGKQYKHSSSFYRHKKTCVYDEHNDFTENILAKEDVNDANPDTDVKVLFNTIFELVKQNNEFKELLIEQNHKMMEMRK